MAIKVSCPSCRKVYNLGDAQAGKKVRCKDCAHVFEAHPDEEATAPVAPKDRASAGARKRANPDVRDEDEERPAKRPARASRDEDEDDRPKRRPSRDEDEDEDERPRRASKSKAKGGIPLWVWLAGGGGLGFFMLIGVGVIVWLVFSGPTISMENYDKIKGKMTEADVIAVLGKPTQTVDANKTANVAGAIFGKDLNRGMPQVKTLTWKNGDNLISVAFIDGKVFSKTIQLNGVQKTEMSF